SRVSGKKFQIILRRGCRSTAWIKQWGRLQMSAPGARCDLPAPLTIVEAWAMEPIRGDDTLPVDREPGSVTRMLSGFKRGSTSAIRPLMEIYYEQLADYLSRMYRTTPQAANHAAAVGRDVALSAWCSFISYVMKNGGKITLEDRGDLWGLL